MPGATHARGVRNTRPETPKPHRHRVGGASALRSRGGSLFGLPRAFVPPKVAAGGPDRASLATHVATNDRPVLPKLAEFVVARLERVSELHERLGHFRHLIAWICRAELVLELATSDRELQAPIGDFFPAALQRR